MTRQQKINQNISNWRALSKEERRRIMHATTAQFAVNSMAMEGELVSQKWLKKNIH